MAKKTISMKNLYELLSLVQDDVTLSVLRDDDEIILSPLRNGEPIDDVPYLLAITSDGQLITYDCEHKLQMIPAIDALNVGDVTPLLCSNCQKVVQNT